MKLILKFGIFTLLVVSLSACNFDDDHYSLGKFWVGFGVVHIEDNSEYFTLEMDNGAVLYPVNHYHIKRLKDKDRILINYTILGDRVITDDDEEYHVRINSMSKILYKGIFDITPATEDSIGNDPIHVRDLWKTRNMLTLDLGYYGHSKAHFINLVKEPGELTAGDQPIQLELRHNSNNDPQSYRMNAFVTFDLSSLQIAGQDSVSYVIKGKDYKGDDYSYTGVYRYTPNNSKSTEANKSVLEEFELR